VTRRSGPKAPAPTRWLRFESATQRRRLAPFPTRWEALDAIELAELCQTATPEAPPVVRRSSALTVDAIWLGDY
jgi:hypothetical protein